MVKAKLGAGLSALQGKIGNVCGKIIDGRQQISRLSIPYGISGEEPTAEQLSVRAIYAQKVQEWRTASDEDRLAWDLLGEPLGISGFNFLMMVSMIDQTGVNPDGTEATTLDSPIVSLKGNMNRIRHWIVALSGEAWGTVTTSTAALAAKFHETTGHKHTGMAGDAPVLPYSGLSGKPDTDLTPYVKTDGTRAFTGPQAGLTADLGTNTTQLATTAFVLANAGGNSNLDGGVATSTYASNQVINAGGAS